MSAVAWFQESGSVASASNNRESVPGVTFRLVGCSSAFSSAGRGGPPKSSRISRTVKAGHGPARAPVRS